MNFDRILLVLTLAVLSFVTYSAWANQTGRWQVATTGDFMTYLVDTHLGVVCEIDQADIYDSEDPIMRARCSTAPPEIAY